MQKVVGSSPIIRSKKAPLDGLFVASVSNASTVSGAVVPNAAHSTAASNACRCGFASRSTCRSPRLQSGISQQEANPAIHDTYRMLLNRVDSFPATEEEFSRGYGLLNEVDGSLTGTSTPVGTSPVYSDDLALQLTLF